MKANAETLTVAAAKARLASSGLANDLRKLVEHRLREGDEILWIGAPWRTSDRKRLTGSPTKTSLLVFEQPIVIDRSVSLRYEDFVTFRGERNEHGFLFLGEVRCRDLLFVPGVLGVFAGGLSVGRLASFDGADAHGQIAHHFHAPLVVSNLAGGSAHVSKGTDVRIAKYARWLGKLPRGTGTSFPSLEALFPFIDEDRIENEDAWEILEDYKDRDFPKSYVVPKLPGLPARASAKKKRPSSRPAIELVAKRKSAPKKTAPKKS